MNKFSKSIVGLYGLCFSFGCLAASQEHSIESITVVAHPLSGEGLSQAVELLEGQELQQSLAANIGETLSKLPGVHSASFGSAVGRPVIHGLGGARVKVLQDRIDTLDVSVTSADHAVGIEPFISERVEVLKGASTLLYGTGAIGGVVNVVSHRIPHEQDQSLSGGIETRRDNNGSGHTTAFKLNGGEGRWAWHLDGALKGADDYDIPGFAESSNLRMAEHGEHDEDHEDEHEEHEEHGEEEAYGTLPGSYFDTKSLAFGSTYFTDWGFFGASVSRLSSTYGLPGGHGHHEEEHEGEDHEEEHEDHEHEEEHEEGVPELDMEQTRTDFELAIEQPFDGFDSLNLRGAINRYEHQEIEPNGEVATDFTNNAWESRLELVRSSDNWQQIYGLQISDREFSAVGEESFIPAVDTFDYGAFWLAERAFDSFDVEAGIRLGSVEHQPESGDDERFTNYAASLGGVFALSEGWQLGLLLDIASRAPVAEELYSDGAHLVTSTYELGDASLDSEQAKNISATLSYESTAWQFKTTAYYTHFSDFIYQQVTDQEVEELPVVEYRQANAVYYGIDTQLAVTVSEWDQGDLSINTQFDYVHARLDVDGNKNLPRTPPMRFGLGFDLHHGDMTASVDYLRVSKQNDVADLEQTSDAYSDLSMYIDVELLPEQSSSLKLFLQGKNLTDDEQRNHSSFIKEFAPAPGRTVSLGVRYLF